MRPQINLLLDLPKPPKQWVASRHMVFTVVIFVGWLVLLNVFGNIQRRGEAKELLKLKTQQQSISEKMLSLGASTGSKALDRNSIKTSVDNLLLELRQRTALKKHLNKFQANNVVGFSPFMTALAQHINPGVWLTQFTVYTGGQNLSLKGKALESTLVTEYLDTLTKYTKVLDKKKFKVVEIESKEEGKDTQVKNEIDFEARTSEDTYTK